MTASVTFSVQTPDIQNWNNSSLEMVQATESLYLHQVCMSWRHQLSDQKFLPSFLVSLDWYIIASDQKSCYFKGQSYPQLNNTCERTFPPHTFSPSPQKLIYRTQSGWNLAWLFLERIRIDWPSDFRYDITLSKMAAIPSFLEKPLAHRMWRFSSSSSSSTFICKQDIWNKGNGRLPEEASKPIKAGHLNRPTN